MGFAGFGCLKVCREGGTERIENREWVKVVIPYKWDVSAHRGGVWCKRESGVGEL